MVGYLRKTDMYPAQVSLEARGLENYDLLFFDTALVLKQRLKGVICIVRLPSQLQENPRLSSIGIVVPFSRDIHGTCPTIPVAFCHIFQYLHLSTAVKSHIQSHHRLGPSIKASNLEIHTHQFISTKNIESQCSLFATQSSNAI